MRPRARVTAGADAGADAGAVAVAAAGAGAAARCGIHLMRSYVCGATFRFQTTDGPVAASWRFTALATSSTPRTQPEHRRSRLCT